MQTVHLDISCKGVYPCIQAKQQETGRKFAAVLTDGGVPFNVPEDAVLSVWYSGASGEGNYSDIAGESAISVEGNMLTVELIEQMVVNAGFGVLCIRISSPDGSLIGLWNMPYSVEGVPGCNSQKAEEYYNAFSEATANLALAAKTFIPDKTLSKSGAPADAAETGRQIAVERERVNTLVAMKGTGGIGEFEISGSGYGGIVITNGIYALVELSVEIEGLEAGNSITYTDFPARYAPYVNKTFKSGNASGITLEITAPEDGAEFATLILTNDFDATFSDYADFYVEYPLHSISIPELYDLHIGHDGTEYPTAGDAVREQVKQALQNNGTVKTVNGTAPDENGNVEIPVVEGAVLYTEQALTPEQQAQARTNIGAVSVEQGVDNAGTLLYVDAEGNVSNVIVDDGIEVAYGHGKNIFHHEWANVQWANGVFFERTDGKNMCSVREKIRVTPGETYTISIGTFSNVARANLYLYEFDENGNFVSENPYIKLVSLTSNSSRSFKVGASTTYIAIQLYVSGANFSDIVPTGTMIEVGGVPTEYEPYFEGYMMSLQGLSEKISDTAYAEHAPSTTVRSIAHRGATKYAPQCTAPAYILARQMGFSVAENDIWSTLDGKYVMWHETALSLLNPVFSLDGKILKSDSEGNRYWTHGNNAYTYDESTQTYSAVSIDTTTLTNVKGATITVAEENYAFLRNIDCGWWKGPQYAGTQILSFEEWIDLCKSLGMECYIDAKFTFTDEQAAELVGIVRKKGMLRKCSWLGYNIESLRKADSKARCGVLWAPTESSIIENGVYDTALKDGGEGSMFFNPRNTEVTAENAELALSHGYGYECWYVTTDALTDEVYYAEIERLLQCGCQGLTLDNHTVEDFMAYKYGNAMKGY